MGEMNATQHAADVMRFVHGQLAQGHLDGKDADASRRALVSTAIARSWRRCAIDYSLDPSRLYPAIIVDRLVLEERHVRHADLLQIASAEIDWLYDHIAGSGYALLLSDAAGIVLYSKMDTVLGGIFRSAGLVLGADWSEPRQGTNGIGTCIIENRPVTVHREEHFRGCHIGLCCAGAPIHDPAGSLIAVLDASTLNDHESPAHRMHTMALVSLSAQLIEKCLFLRHFEQGIVLRFHARPELVNLQHDGALALAHDATVIAADESAVRLLGAASREELVGRRIDEIFDVRAEELVDPSRSPLPLLSPVNDVLMGARFFASLSNGNGNGNGRSRASNAGSRITDPQPVLQLAATSERKSLLTLEELAGEDPQMLRNVRSARRIAASQVSVMIQGPTGAGKEAFARGLHAASGRAAKPFVALNCAAIPESLIESELFGYRPGAFTGARKEGMKGKVLQSSEGTLFLDEIGDMPLALQTRLLRVLEEKEVVPLGAETPIKVDLHVVCASHQNLRAMIARGLFREDLYYRLNGITLELPPLAQRSDKEQLIRQFLAAETSDGRPAAIEMDAFDCLLAYGWPGNIRELRNVIRTALAICDGGVVRLKDLPSEVRDGVKLVPQSGIGATAGSANNGSPMQDSQERGPLEAAERGVLLRAIQQSDGNMSRAAKLLGVSRNTLYRRCKRLDLPLRTTHPSTVN